MGALPRGRAELLHGSGGPGRQRKRVLVRLDEVAETNRAVGQRPDHVQHLLQQLLQGVVCGRIEQRQSKPKCLFNPPALGNVGQYGAALTAAVIGGYRLDVHPQWRALLWTDRQIADLFGLALEYFFEKSVEGGAILRGDEEAEARPDQAGALQSQQTRPGEIHPADRPVAIECHVADGREVVEVGVTFHPRLQFCPRPLQLFVLQLQLDLMNLQLVDQTLHVFRCGLASGLRPSRSLLHPAFRPCAQLPGVRRRALSLLHSAAPCTDCVARRVASSVLAALMSTKVITTPSIRLSSVR